MLKLNKKIFKSTKTKFVALERENYQNPWGKNGTFYKGLVKSALR